MHDTFTVAFEIRYPWVSRRHRLSTNTFLRTYHDPFITIWHVDPETDGTDDSCGWQDGRLTDAQEAAMMQIIHNPDDNICAYFPDTSEYHMEFVVACIARYAKRVLTPRPWWQHPRWHVWHWRIQCHPLMAVKRRLFTRCAACGRPFAWGAAVFARGWGSGPRWFRSEQEVYHHDCYPHVPARLGNEQHTADSY